MMLVMPVDIGEQMPKWKALDRWENEGGMIPVEGNDVPLAARSRINSASLRSSVIASGLLGFLSRRCDVKRELDPIAQVLFVENAADMSLDGSEAEIEFCCDLFVT